MRISFSRRTVRTAVALVGGVAVAASLSACSFTGTISGGGWVGTTSSNAKINVGVNLDCSQTPYAGTLSFIDRSTVINGQRVSFTVPFNGCDTASEINFAGIYVPRPKGAAGGIYGNFYDTGAKGPSKGDRIQFCLVEGAFNGYCIDTILDGGNITVTG